jgi:hypothetical protein
MSTISCCKACHKMFIPSDVIVIEERSIEDGGHIMHNFGLDFVCAECKNAAFSDEDYEDMFEDKWVKPCKFQKYVE